MCICEGGAITGCRGFFFIRIDICKNTRALTTFLKETLLQLISLTVPRTVIVVPHICQQIGHPGKILNRKMLAVNNIKNQMGKADIYKTFHSNTEYTSQQDMELSLKQTTYLERSYISNLATYLNTLEEKEKNNTKKRIDSKK